MEKIPKDLITVIIIICILTMLVLCLFIVWFVYKYQQKQNLHLIEIAQLKVIHENAILQSKIEIQEQTFQNISRDIHDNVGQKLTLAKLQLVSLKGSDKMQLSDIAAAIGYALDDLRNLSRTLSSDIILQNGLVEAINYEVTQLTKTNLFEIRFELLGENVFLDGKRELILFRIIQEALQNIVKHAKATKVWIVAEYQTDDVIIIIKDNGTGFREAAAKGLGLTNIQTRATLLGGNCEISSQPGYGTTLNLIIPINESIEPD